MGRNRMDIREMLDQMSEGHVQEALDVESGKSSFCRTAEKEMWKAVMQKGIAAVCIVVVLAAATFNIYQKQRQTGGQEENTRRDEQGNGDIHISRSEEITLLQSDSSDVMVDNGFGRITMGSGMAVKTEQYVYASDRRDIYRLDLITGEVTTQISDVSFGAFLSAHENILYYGIAPSKTMFYAENLMTGTISRYVLDSGSIYDEDRSLTDIYVTEHYAYALTGRQGSLLRIDLQTGAADIIAENHILMYAKNGKMLYYLESLHSEEKDADNDLIVLWELNEESGVYTKLELDINPITVLAYEGKLYMTEQGTWDFYVYDLVDGDLEQIEQMSETYEFQVNGDWIYYLEEYYQEPANGTVGHELKRCSLQTGETETLIDKVSSFSLFDDGSMVVNLVNDEPAPDESSEICYYVIVDDAGEWLVNQRISLDAGT